MTTATKPSSRQGNLFLAIIFTMLTLLCGVLALGHNAYFIVLWVFTVVFALRAAYHAAHMVK